jgi:hypothetical protein
VKKLSYIDIINAFERWLTTNHLPSGSQLLYYKLLMLFNKCAWQEWISADNKRLMSEIKVKREETFIKLRQSLIDKELIEYKKGRKGSPGKYRLKEIAYEKEVQSGVKNGVQNGVQSGAINRERERTRERQSHYLAIMTLYGQMCISLPVCKTLTQKRQQALKARQQGGYEKSDFELLFCKAQASSFLRGENYRGWKADFDWLINEQNMKKVLDGLYDDAPKNRPKEKSDNIFIQLLREGGAYGQAGRT